MAGAEFHSSTVFSRTAERKLVLILCGLAAIHVFVFAAAFPFFNNVDERPHFDMVERYSQGHVPRGVVNQSAETLQSFGKYASWQYLWRPDNFPGDRYPPPPWKQPAARSAPKVTPQNNGQPAREDPWLQIVKATKAWPNYEATQPPLYYAAAALWWHAGQWCGFTGGRLLYWIRFLNILFVVTLVWVGHVAARTVFPENQFLRLGTPALLAFLPQTVFFSITNDMPSPLCFGVAFICLVKWWQAETPGARLGVATGLALAATFLTKLSNAPLLAVAAAAVLLKTGRLARKGKLRASVPALAALVLCAGLPAGGWMLWAKHAYGDFTGSAAKIHSLGWTLKPFGEWWHHPIFTLPGLWAFASRLLQTLWQGDFWWHAQPLDLPWVNALYVVPSLCFLSFAVAGLLRNSSSNLACPQLPALWLMFGCLAASVAFLAFLSIIFNFGNCPYPSSEHPYFDAGRLMIGALVPFLLFFLFGVNYVLRGMANKWLWPLLLAGMISFMLASEIVTDWTVFPSQYNWFHM